MTDKRVTRATLAKYAGLLGHDSLAAMTLRAYDHLKAAKDKPVIHMHLIGFSLSSKRGNYRYD